MRIITIAPELLAQLFAVADGPFVDIPVSVAWPELQLTTDQRLANSISALQGQAPPHADPGVFLLRLPVMEQGDGGTWALRYPEKTDA